MIPGEIISPEREIILNAGRQTGRLKVMNLGDRPIQVGSHFHFFEVNRCLAFERADAYGMRLDIPSGTSVRFEPGESKTISLVEFGGRHRTYGANGLVDGQAEENSKTAALLAAEQKGFPLHLPGKYAGADTGGNGHEQ